MCLLGDLEKEPAAQTPGNKAVLPRGCREKKKKLALRHRCSGKGRLLARRLGLAFLGPATPGRGAGTGRAETACATTTTESPPPPHIPRAATNSQVGAGLRGPLGAGRQGAAQRPAQPDVVGACRSLGSVPGLWRPGRRCWEEGHLEFTPLKLV